MAYKKVIEVWFTTTNEGRDYKEAATLTEAKVICKKLLQEGFWGIVVDITFYDSEENLIESKSKWYSFSTGKLKQI